MRRAAIKQKRELVLFYFYFSFILVLLQLCGPLYCDAFQLQVNNQNTIQQVNKSCTVSREPTPVVWMSICQCITQTSNPRCPDACFVPPNLSFRYFIKQRIHDICKALIANWHRTENASNVSSQMQAKCNYFSGYQMLCSWQWSDVTWKVNCCDKILTSIWKQSQSEVRDIAITVNSG